MKIRVALVLAFSLLTVALRAEKFSLVGATVINPADGKLLPNATVVINGDKIERVAMGKQDAATLGKQISCVGKFILPGYIDTHVHFFQSADLFTRPDGADWPTLYFCLKEAAFKAFYPTYRRIIGFQDMRVRVDLDARRFLAELSGLSASGIPIFQGRYLVRDGRVHAACW